MKNQRILLTGATGAIGPNLIESLLANNSVERINVLIRSGKTSLEDRFAQLCDTIDDKTAAHRLHPIAGNVTDDSIAAALADFRGVDVVIHAAGDTRFRATDAELEQTNVVGTHNMLAWAKRCSNLNRFVFVSTACVAGTKTGQIPEALGLHPPEFVNAYERSKWMAERLVAASKLPASIVRLSTVLGSERTGECHRLGAAHHALQWVYRGLIPMMPGTPKTRIDLISSEFAAACVARAALAHRVPNVLHVAAGAHAIPMTELLDFAVEQFAIASPAWRNRQIAPPMLVDRPTFDLFRDSIHRSGDVLFRSVLDSVASFLPAMLYPKIYETDGADALMGGSASASDWQTLLRRVIARCVVTQTARPIPREVAHA